MKSEHLLILYIWTSLLSGMIRVSVTAANNISSLNATNQIRAIERIRDIQSEAENPVVNLDEYVVVGVKVFGGAYGVVMVIFEDDINITFTKYFLHKLHENTSTLHFSHRYCIFFQYFLFSF